MPRRNARLPKPAFAADVRLWNDLQRTGARCRAPVFPALDNEDVPARVSMSECGNAWRGTKAPSSRCLLLALSRNHALRRKTSGMRPKADQSDLCTYVSF